MTKTARIAVNTTAVAVVGADKVLAPMYAKARIEARETSNNWGERDAKMEKWDKVVNGVNAAYKFLAAAEIGVETWNTTGEQADFLTAAGCAASALSQVRAGLAELDIEVPDAINQALDLLLSFGPDTCFP